MNRLPMTVLRIGDWRVDPASGQISRNGQTVRLDARAMRLLTCLAERKGGVASIDELLSSVWVGVTVSPDSVYQAVASLRRELGDDPKEPKYIETVPRLGYRLIAPVEPWKDEGVKSAESLYVPYRKPPTPGGARPAAFGARHTKAGLAWAASALCLLLGIGAWTLLPRPNPKTSLPSRTTLTTIAVVPFLDLTQGMTEEEFADGMTEELIDRLSNLQGVRVSAPTSSFSFKGRQAPPGEIAKALGVAYLLDGSVRKSGDRVRVAARLLRADNGYVLWNSTYDRRFGDMLKVQDDIAGEVAKALKAPIAGVTPGVTPK